MVKQGSEIVMRGSQKPSQSVLEESNGKVALTGKRSLEWL